jgi:hypothetical protein
MLCTSVYALYTHVCVHVQTTWGYRWPTPVESQSAIGVPQKPCQRSAGRIGSELHVCTSGTRPKVAPCRARSGRLAVVLSRGGRRCTAAHINRDHLLAGRAAAWAWRAACGLLQGRNAAIIQPAADAALSLGRDGAPTDLVANGREHGLHIREFLPCGVIRSLGRD